SGDGAQRGLYTHVFLELVAVARVEVATAQSTGFDSTGNASERRTAAQSTLGGAHGAGQRSLGAHVRHRINHLRGRRRGRTRRRDVDGRALTNGRRLRGHGATSLRRGELRLCVVVASSGIAEGVGLAHVTSSVGNP